MNSFDAELEKLNKQYRPLIEKSVVLTEGLEWYDRFNADETHARVLRLHREADAARDTITTLEVRKLHLQQRRDAAVRDAGSGGLLGGFFSSTRAVAARSVEKLNEEIANVAGQIAQIARTITQHQAEEQAGMAALGKYRAFDRLCAVAMRGALINQAAQLEIQIEPLQARKNKLDKQLAPVIKKLNELHAKNNVVARECSVARCYLNAIAGANGDARARLRAEARNQFPDSSLASVIRKSESEQAHLAREITKIRNYVADRVRWAQLDVRTVYLDGSNLCNANGRFIGLEPLVMLATTLAESRNVKITFDHKIQLKLKMRHPDIRRRFPSSIKVEFSPHGKPADQYLLYPASDDPYACVISDDNFTEFAALDVIQQKRILPGLLARRRACRRTRCPCSLRACAGHGYRGRVTGPGAHARTG